MRAATLPGLVLFGLFAGCGGEPTPAPAGAPAGRSGQPVQPVQPAAVEHDFGVIPHGEKRTHDYVLDVRSLGVDCVPLRAQLDCSCGRAVVLLRHRDGTERAVDGSPASPNAPTADETVVVRVTVDTVTKDAVDLPKTVSRGYVVLQPLRDRDGTQRVQWPLIVRFGIDSPVVLQPFAALDFGRVPLSSTPEILTTLRGDERHPAAKFGPVRCSEAAITATLEPGDGHTVLRARCRPGEAGNHRAVLQVDSDLPGGYQVNLGVQWKVVPDVEAIPMAKLSLRADLQREQPAEAASGQFLVVVDHDPARGPEFVVHEIVGDDGRDARSSFAVTFTPVPQQPTQHRLFVRYLGGQPTGFRGRLVLAKPGGQGPFLSIELVLFAAKAP